MYHIELAGQDNHHSGQIHCTAGYHAAPVGTKIVAEARGVQKRPSDFLCQSVEDVFACGINVVREK